MKLSKLLCTLVLLLLPASLVFAQTGKISGVVTDAATGEGLPGVNVAIPGTLQGAVTDVDGFYFINNVRPGTYELQASFVGFVTETILDVRVNTGLTTEIDVALREEAVGLAEVTVTAERPIVQRDVSANVASLNPTEFEDLPVAGVSEVIDLQAGIEPGLQIRGGGLNQVAFVVDGMNMRTGRNNNPITNISFTSLEEVQVQTGGFNAEYGNVRSGIVTVATKEPSRTRYSFDAMLRYEPKQDKSLNALGDLDTNDDLIADCDWSDPNWTCDNWFIRSAADPAVAFDGTSGVWDPYTERQYNTWEGWNAYAQRLQDGSVTGVRFDVTADDMLKHFVYTKRKDNSPQVPDYEADMTLGGPLLPGGLSAKLGDLRFLASYRGTQSAYIIPQTRDHYGDHNFQLKMISDIAQGMKLTVHGMRLVERGMAQSKEPAEVRVWKGNLPVYPWSGTSAHPLSNGERRGAVEYSDGASPLANIDHIMYGAKLVHTLNANTFYEVSVQNIASKYRSKFPNLRDDTYLDDQGNLYPVLWTDGFGDATDAGNASGQLVCFGGTSDINLDGVITPYCAGQEPFGYSGTGGNVPTGETTGGHWNKTRDTSDVSVFTGRFDLTSQVNRWMQVKTGAELSISDYNMNYKRVNLELVGPTPGEDHPFDRTPIQGAAYAQTKLEFQGMVANIGLRLDYFDPNTEWWEYTPYDAALRGQVDVLDETLTKSEPDAQVNISPRLGIAFPITDNSKLYFNYGHFRQMLSPFQIFGIRQSRTGGINRIGNPNHPMPTTVAYELGFDQNLFDQYLLRISGFYRDIRQQGRTVTYEGLGAVVHYQTYMPWNYGDNRGAEITITKNRGRYLRGFVNFTFLQRKGGDFGYGNFYENSFDMRNYLRSSTDYRQWLPIAEPFARMNLIFMTPPDFGPDVASGNPLGDWRVSFLGEWRAGRQWTWSGGGNYPELQENVQWRDYMNFDLRFTKHLNMAFGSAQLFVDISNVFGRKHIYQTSAFHEDNRDFDYYMWSLHLPDDTYSTLNDPDNPPYTFVPGDDRPGDFRDPDIDFQPIEAFRTLDAAEASSPNEYAWYWIKESGDYLQWTGSAWQTVPDGDVQQVLDDKAYIDMPNLLFKTFLNPRRFTLGLRVSF